MAAFIDWLSNTGLSAWIRESNSLWAYPGVITFHSVGLAIMVGLSAVIALRVLGVASGLPLAAMSRLYGMIWVGFVLNAVSGVLLLISEPTLLVNKLLWFKLALIAASITTIVRMNRRVLLTPEAKANRVPDGGRGLAYATLVLWSAATTVGRLTAYLGQ